MMIKKPKFRISLLRFRGYHIIMDPVGGRFIRKNPNKVIKEMASFFALEVHL